MFELMRFYGNKLIEIIFIFVKYCYDKRSKIILFLEICFSSLSFRLFKNLN